MKRTLLLLTLSVVFQSNFVWADNFGTGGNQFTIDFLTITGDASSANGTNISQAKPGQSIYKYFTDPGDFRIGKFEITNDQWNKFRSELGVPVTGYPLVGYNSDSDWTTANLPTNRVSWYEAAQFVNWLNTSSGHQAAYKFINTQGTADYTFALWEESDEGYNVDNPYRNLNAFYFLPTEEEWVKAAYWNGATLQTYAMIGDFQPVSGQDSNYAWGLQPWEVGSGSIELNGTFDMMGNLYEWVESSAYVGENWPESDRATRGGSYYYTSSVYDLMLTGGGSGAKYFENEYDGFRIASIVPEPCSVLLFGLGGLVMAFKRR